MRQYGQHGKGGDVGQWKAFSVALASVSMPYFMFTFESMILVGRESCPWSMAVIPQPGDMALLALNFVD